MVGTADSVLNREVSFIWSFLYGEVPLYYNHTFLRLCCRNSMSRMSVQTGEPSVGLNGSYASEVKVEPPVIGGAPSHMH